MPVLELALLFPLFLAAVLFSRRFAKTSHWFLPAIGAFLLLTLIILGRRFITLSILPPFSWAIDADVGPLLLAITIPALLTPLILRLNTRSKRLLTTLLMIMMTLAYSALPLASPLFARSSLINTPSHWDSHHTCLQTHAYTCGPAAAATCLAVLNIPANEATLALAARSGPLVGTDPILLQNAMNAFAAPHHFHCIYRVTSNLDSLHTPFIATMWLPGVGGHYVAVLQVTANALLIADPLSGLSKYSREDFLSHWQTAAHEFIEDGPSPRILPSPTSSLYFLP